MFRFLGRIFFGGIEGFVVIAAILVVIYAFVFRPFEVVGVSMFPTFKDGEFLLSNLLDVRFDRLKRGDVIVFHSPVEEEKDYVKRIIAIPGETVEIRGGKVYINGQVLDESAYISHDIYVTGSLFMREGDIVTVPAGTYFVMGDNRNQSSDSREWGFLTKDKIIGRSIIRVWPLDQMMIIRNPFSESSE